MSNNQQVATTNQSKSLKLATFLDSKIDAFREVETVDSERFLRVLKNAILRDPEIAEASMTSVYSETMKAMNDGLVLDGREAALTRFKVNKKHKDGSGKWVDNWVTEVVYIPMVAGIMKRVRASGEIKSWTVELVYLKEHEEGRFRYRAAPDPIIEHDPIIVGERGPVVAAYSAVKLADGSHHYEVMTLDELLAIKSRTKSKKKKYVDGKPVKENGKEVEEISGPWATDENEMFRKTVIRRHAKRLPVSSATMQVTSRVDSLYDFDSYEVNETPAPPPKHAKSNAASKLKAAKAQQQAAQKPKQEEAPADDEKVLEGEIIDGETGEVLDGANADEGDEEKGEGAGTPNPEDEF